MNIIALELYFDAFSTDEKEVVPSKLKKSAKQTDNVASKEVQQVKERYLSSFSFIIFDISVPNHGVHLEHKILLWRSIWLLLPSYANTFNPLTVKNYQHLISLYNIPPESNINVHQSLFVLKVSYLDGLLSLELLFRER